MRHLYRTIVTPTATFALTCLAIVAPVAAADHPVSLSHLAPALGYTYTWIGSESAVALTRPGLYILVRTGNSLYDVNDQVESIAQAPQFRNNDIYVCSAMATRLRALAAKYAPSRQAAGVADAPNMPTSAHGSLTVSAVPTNVSDAVIVTGTGPASVPLTITLSADIQRDMPRVVLSRTNIQTDSSGKFVVQISTAPLYLQKSLILISATSLPGVSEAHTSFILGQASPNIAHPLDELPRDFRPL